MPSWPAIHVSHNGVVSGKRGEKLSLKNGVGSRATAPLTHVETRITVSEPRE